MPYPCHMYIYLFCLSLFFFFLLVFPLAPETIFGLLQVIAADHSARPPTPAGIPPSAKELFERSRELDVMRRAPAPILKGRHLLARGLPPGPEMGKILRAAYEAQLDGAFTDLSGALEWFLKVSFTGR